ncbi:TPX2, C-terminal [Dillenia turbinata]|uniref:TPX2, C-terminal n=1 Tax=Dillenia turbinata TaxID=194707 RepID=A0AAN8ZAY2_9MAGN
MGESIVELPNVQNKMEESAASKADIQVSVSFGRFENDDTLSWEKWSSFSHNKYLEEVGKCSTPGSVAQKKAYFEAHYKKIAARKAELMDQEKKVENDVLDHDDPNYEEPRSEFSSSKAEIDVTKEKSTEEQDRNLIEGNGNDVDEAKDNGLRTGECENSFVEEAKNDLDCKQDNPKLDTTEETALVDEDYSSVKPPEDKEPSKEMIDQIVDIAKEEEITLKPHPPKQPQKVKYLKTTKATTRERNMSNMKRKPVSNVPRLAHISTPKVSKPTSTSTVMSTSRSSAKKQNVPSLPKSQSPLGESRKAAPKALHMSLSQSSVNSDSAPATTRRSFIMEKMRDKDIVKRAFKMFQNSYHLSKSSNEDPSPVLKEVLAKGREQKISTSVTPRKKNVGFTQLFSVTFVHEILETIFSKKLEEKSTAKEAEQTCLQSKTKEGKDAGIKKLRQSLNFKATPMPRFYKGQGTPKNLIKKASITDIS